MYFFEDSQVNPVTDYMVYPIREPKNTVLNLLRTTRGQSKSRGLKDSLASMESNEIDSGVE